MTNQPNPVSDAFEPIRRGWRNFLRALDSNVTTTSPPRQQPATVADHALAFARTCGIDTDKWYIAEARIDSREAVFDLLRKDGAQGDKPDFRTLRIPMALTAGRARGWVAVQMQELGR